MNTTSNIALQTFLELQVIKSMINNTKIELWQEGTSYDANKPIRYGGKLYICNLAHVAGETFDISKFDVLESSSGGAVSEDIAFSNDNFTATDVKAALIELFQNVSNGKTTIASAITDKGQTVSGSNTFAQLATAISAIQTGGAISKDTRLNITAPYTKTIILDNPRDIEDLCTSILEYVPGSTFSQYNCNFDNGDSSSFNYNNSYTLFDGLMKLITTYSATMSSQGTLGLGTLYESQAIDIENFNYIESISGNEAGLTITATPKAQVIKANGDIDLTGIARLNAVSLTSIATGGGIVKMAVSVDSGVTWKTFYSNAWTTFNPDNKEDFNSYGMTEATVEALTFGQLETLRGSATTIRFAYYIERPTYSADASTDQIALDVLLPGSSQVCPSNKFSLSYNEGTKTITYNITESGTYSFTWIS